MCCVKNPMEMNPPLILSLIIRNLSRTLVQTRRLIFNYGNSLMITSHGDVLLDYCVQEGFEIKKKKFDHGRVTAVCKSEAFPWRIHASKTPDGLYFIIKTFKEEHNYQQVRRNKTASPTWIAKNFSRCFSRR